MSTGLRDNRSMKQRFTQMHETGHDFVFDVSFNESFQA